MSPRLYVALRTCVCCRRSAEPGARPSPGEPNIMGISMTLYRRGRNPRSSLQAAGKVNICEECFVRAMAGNDGPELVTGIKQSLSTCYSAMIDDGTGH